MSEHARPKTHRPIISYKGEEPYAFFSYPHAYRNFVRELVRLLTENGVRVATDGGTSYIDMPDEYYERIKNCRVYILELSHRTVDSQRVRKEIRCIDRNTPIIVLEKKKTALDPELSHILSRAVYIKIRPFWKKDRDHLPQYALSKLLPLLPRDIFI